MTKIYTTNGWEDLDLTWDEYGIITHNDRYVRCCDCGKPATRITNAGTEFNKILWAHCYNCAHESKAESACAAHNHDA